MVCDVVEVGPTLKTRLKTIGVSHFYRLQVKLYAKFTCTIPDLSVRLSLHDIRWLIGTSIYPRWSCEKRKMLSALRRTTLRRGWGGTMPYPLPPSVSLIKTLFAKRVAKVGGN